MLVFEEIARRELGMPEDWSMMSWERLPDCKDGEPLLPMTHLKIEGAVAPKLPDGHRDWDNQDLSTYRVIVLPVEGHEEKVKAWEAETGLCAKCKNTGRYVCGWSRDHGNSYRPCNRCERGAA